jgi:hypothetical protein
MKNHSMVITALCFFVVITFSLGSCANPASDQDVVSETVEEATAGKAIARIKLPMPAARSAYTDGMIAQTASVKVVIFKNNADNAVKVFEKMYDLSQPQPVIIELTTGFHTFALTAYNKDGEILGKGETTQDLLEGDNNDVYIELVAETATATIEAGWKDLSMNPITLYSTEYTVQVGQSVGFSACKSVDEPFSLATDSAILFFEGETIHATAAGTAEVTVSVPPYLPVETFRVRVVSCLLDELGISATRGETTKSYILTDDKTLRGGKAILHLEYGAQEMKNYWGQYIIARLLGINGEKIAEQRFDFLPTSSWGAIPAEPYDFVFDLGEQSMNVESVELTLYDGDYYAYTTGVDISFID